MSSPVFQAHKISFRYGQDSILEDISFDISQGEFVGIIGPNGSGKTTLLKILLGLLQPDHGSVRFSGNLVKAGKHPQIGYIPQKFTQLETRFPITVEEVVGLGRLSARGMLPWTTSEDSDVITQSLASVNLLPFRHRLITELSGGQQQRAFIAKALAGNPEVLILDEPTVGIDAESQEHFYSILAELNTQKNLTIIIVSHDVDVVLNEVSTVLCLNKTLVYHGDSKAFLKDSSLEKLYGKNKKMIIHGHAH